METIYMQLFLILISFNAITQNIPADADILKPVKAECAINIDGKLNEPIWQKATQPQDRPEGYYDCLLENNTYYNYLWWAKFRNGQKNANDFFRNGKQG